MAFSFTVNDVYYSEADFTPSNYHINFLKLLRDCVEHLPKKLSAIGSNKGLGVYDPTTLVVGGGKAFYPGMPVVAFLNYDFPPVICHMVVTSYSSDTLVCSIVATYGSFPAFESDNWQIVSGGPLRQLTSTPYLGLTNLTESTIEDVRRASGAGRPSVRYEPYMEDFCGHLPTVTNPEGSNGLLEQPNSPGMCIRVYGKAQVSFDGNQVEMFADGNSPGIAVMQVTNPGDEAQIIGKGVSNISSSACARFRIFIPEFEEGEEVEIFLGQANGPGGTYQGSWICFNHRYPRDSKGYFLEGRYQSAISGPSYLLQTFPPSSGNYWAQGRWLLVAHERYEATPASYVGFIEDDTANFYAEAAMPNFTGSSGSECPHSFPAVYVRKKRGSKPARVYLDYIAFETMSSQEDFSR